MNNLIIVAVLGILVIGGVALLVGASANPTGKVTDSLQKTSSIKLPPIVDGKQDVFLRATEYGTYSPNYLVVKQGVPVRIHYTVDERVGCGREVVFPEYKIRKMGSFDGEVLIEFTPEKKGKFPFHCPMQMFRGTIEVV